jgi:phage terminase small subunit
VVKVATLANPRHEAFAQNLANGMTQIAAYEAAGYGRSTGRPAKLAKDARIVARVAELMRAREEKTNQSTALAIRETGLSKAWVLERLRENVERSMQAKPVLDKESQPTGEYRYEGAVANRALELLGKELGMFIDRSHLDVSFEQRLATMTPEQRMELARDMATRLKEQVARYREIEGQASEVTPDESEDQGK